MSQLYYDNVNDETYIWCEHTNAWQPAIPSNTKAFELKFAGIYDAENSKVEQVTKVGERLGFFVGKNIPPTFPVNHGYFVIVSKSGTPLYPAPEEPINPPDYLISTPAGWKKTILPETTSIKPKNRIYKKHERLFLNKYKSPIGYCPWTKIAEYFLNINIRNKKDFYNATAYYLTDELCKALINTDIKNLKVDPPNIINYEFFIIPPSHLCNIEFIYVCCETNKKEMTSINYVQKDYSVMAAFKLKNEAKDARYLLFDWDNPADFGIEKGAYKSDYAIYREANKLIVNLILLMNQQPELITKEILSQQTIQSATGFNKKQNEPRSITWVGKDFTQRVVQVSENETEKGVGKPKRSHWRRGHWHTVLQGPKRKQRRMKWFQPVFIQGNAK